jgi:hypothetical protein
MGWGGGGEEKKARNLRGLVSKLWAKVRPTRVIIVQDTKDLASLSHKRLLNKIRALLKRALHKYL